MWPPRRVGRDPIDPATGCVLASVYAVPEIQAVLLDVFDTMLSVDFGLAFSGLVAGSDLSAEEWRAGWQAYGGKSMRGAITQREAFSATFRLAGKEPQDLDALVRLDSDLLRQHATLHPDTEPFLEQVRAMGLKIAFVSNCAENTSALLSGLQLWERADAIVLSCEVGCAKPDAGIYRAALEALETTPQSAILVDDQAEYCAGAEALGLATVQISRFSQDPGAVKSLTEVLPLLGA